MRVALVLISITAGIFLLVAFGLSFIPRAATTPPAAQIFYHASRYDEIMLRDLEKLRIDYLNGSEAKRSASRLTVAEQFRAYPPDRMSPKLRQFYYDTLLKPSYP